MRIAALAWLMLFTALAGGTPLATAEPLDLGERRARPVRVAFEISPSHLPARLDHQYSALAPAWFEPGPAPGQATVRVAGPDYEEVVASSDPVPGSFGDFVWIFDVETGHVLSATLTGAFYQRVDWGFLKTRVQAKIVARMTTLRAAGFQPPRTLFGRVLFDHCGGSDAECDMVAPRPYDHATGYVNAVGSISVRAVAGLATETFSPLGEAVFTEMREDTAVSAR